MGKDDTENREVRTWGRPPDFDFPPKDHVTLGHELDIIDIPRGVKIAGSRSYFLKATPFASSSPSSASRSIT